MAVNAIILAAGSGSRLQPYTDDRPKSLVELAGKPLIEHQLAVLASRGITDVTIVVGYRKEMLAAYGSRTAENPAWATTNMVETLFYAADRIGPDTIIAYADIIYEGKVLDALLASNSPVSVIVDRGWRSYWEHRFADPLADAESLRLDGQGRIVEIGDKVADIEEIQAQYIGLMRYQGAGVDLLKDTRAKLGVVRRPWMDRRPLEKAYMTDLLMEMILLGHPPQAVPIDHGWLEIDTVSDYESAMAMVADGSITRFYHP